MDRDALITELARVEQLLAGHPAVRTVDQVRLVLADLRAGHSAAGGPPAAAAAQVGLLDVAGLARDPVARVVRAVTAGTCDRDGCGVVYARGDQVGRTSSGRTICGGCLP